MAKPGVANAATVPGTRVYKFKASGFATVKNEFAFVAVVLGWTDKRVSSRVVRCGTCGTCGTCALPGPASLQGC